MLSGDQREKMDDFQQSVANEGIPDEKMSQLVKVAAAMAIECYF